MTSRTRFLALSSTTAVLLTAGAVPALAAPAGDTQATFDVTPGALSISVPAVAPSLKTVLDSVAGGAATGRLGTITVSDTRPGSSHDWTTDVRSGSFTLGTNSLPASGVDYSAGSIFTAGPGGTPLTNFIGYDLTDISTRKTAVYTAGVTKNNSAEWNPTITVAVPSGTAGGTYAGTITHSVA